MPTVRGVRELTRDIAVSRINSNETEDLCGRVEVQKEVEVQRKDLVERVDEAEGFV